MILTEALFLNSPRSLYPLVHIWLDGTPTTFMHAFFEELAYEWIVEIVNPYPLPLMENKEYVMYLSFEMDDGTTYSSLAIQSYTMEQGNEFTVYRFFMYPHL